MQYQLACTVALFGAAASGQTMTYAWTVTTDDGDSVLTPGEAALLALWVEMDPDPGTGFAGTIFDIRGVRNWDTGRVDAYANQFWNIGGDEGFLEDDNDISSIECFQLPPLFNPDFVADNPVLLYEIVWSTDDYTARDVVVADTNHYNNDVYTDEFGTSESYDGIPAEARFRVVPGPGVAAILATVALGASRRRR